MTRSKKAHKKWQRKQGTGVEGSTPKEAEIRITPITNLFKGDEIQEIASILQVPEVDNSHSFLAGVVLSKFDIVKKLLKQGYSIDSCTKDGTTALMWSITLGHWEMVELLVKRGADLILENGQGNTPLLVAVQSPIWSQEMFIDFWNLARESKVEVNHQNKMGNTVLHYAVKRQWEQAVEVLTAQGADTNIATNKGVTPVMMACSRHQMQITKILLSHSAELCLENKKGCTAYCYSIAYMIQKKIVTIESPFNEMIEVMRKDSTKLSLKMYLQRRLELLQNPPVDKFHKTISAVIVHVVTFFLRFVTEGVTIFLQLEVFKVIRNAIEKHIEDNDYVLSLLNVLSELVRQCDCCMTHVPWDDVIVDLSKAGVPATLLKIIKRFGSTSTLHINLYFCFLPIFLTCKHPETKTWLQRNYKTINPYYQIYLEVCSSRESASFYPDKRHTQIVLEHILHFKYLMGLLQKGNLIQEAEHQSKKKKDKTSEGMLNLSKRNNALDSIECDIQPDLINVNNTKDQNQNKHIIISVISNKRKGVEQRKTEELDDEIKDETYWLCTKIKKEHNFVMKKYGTEENTNGKTLYPKWQEEFKGGCELFGIDIEDHKAITCENKSRTEDRNIDIFPTIFQLQQLFSKVLYMFEIICQRDFSNGYTNANVVADLPEFCKLMSNLPNMEVYYWITLLEKWENLFQNLSLQNKEYKINSAENIQKYLESTLSLMNQKYRISINIKESDVLEGLCKCEGGFTLFEDILVKNNNCIVFEEHDISNESNKCLHLDDQDKMESTSTKLYNCSSSSSSNFSNSGIKNEGVDNKMNERIYLHSSPPPGFINLDEMMNNKIYEENWRQIEFSKEKYESIVSEFQDLRIENLKHCLHINDIILTKNENQFFIGHGGSLGSVILGLDSMTAKPLAVKRVSQNESLAHQLRTQKMCSLMRRLKNIQSKYIVPYTHCIKLENYILLATPLCQRNLSDHLNLLKNGKCFTRARAHSLAKQVLKGIHFLHTHDPPIIHGNMKPNNILIDAMGHLRLAEFGIYEVLYQQICPSSKSTMWWSCETIWNYQGKVEIMITFESDIQVCGMICHYILSGGYHPFGLNPRDITMAILDSTPLLRIDESEALDLISWMISHIPKERPTASQIMVHIFNWNKAKKWRFLLVCAGVIQTKLSIIKLHESIDRKAKNYGIDTKWIQKVEGQMKLQDLSKKYNEKLSGLLNLLRNTLPSSSKWFLSKFTSLPFTLYRLLEDSSWLSHPDLAEFNSL